MVRCVKSIGEPKYRFYTEATDFWSLGIVAFGMFSKTGTKGVFREFSDPKFVQPEGEKQSDILNKQPLLHKVVCPLAREFVKKCLQKEVVYRVTNFNEASKFEVFQNIVWNDMFSRKCKPPQTVLELQTKAKHLKAMPYIDDFIWSSPGVKSTVKDLEASKSMVEKAVQTTPTKSPTKREHEGEQEMLYVPKKIARASPRPEAVENGDHANQVPNQDSIDVLERLQTLRNEIRQTGEEVDELLMGTDQGTDGEVPSAKVPISAKASTLAKMEPKVKLAKTKPKVKLIEQDPSQDAKLSDRVPTYENIHGRIKRFLESVEEGALEENFPKDFQLIAKQCDKKQTFYFKCSLCQPKHRKNVQGLFSKGLILVRISGNRFDISAVKKHIKVTHKLAEKQSNHHSHSEAQDGSQGEVLSKTEDEAKGEI